MVFGIDFTSRPSLRKPITGLECRLRGRRLEARELHEWPGFDGLESFLRRPGPWIAGLDFPFGQSRRFIETAGWPSPWREYVPYAASLGRNGFRDCLDAYRASRPPGDKEHRRATDIAAGSISPQKVYGTPVGLMFFEGAPRLLQAGVDIPGLHRGDPQRTVVEAYPGILARSVIGRRSYKQDTVGKQTAAQAEARKELLRRVTRQDGLPDYDLVVEAPATLADDPGGDHLDALLCAIQAAWAWTRRESGYGAPAHLPPEEGWIADPQLIP